MRVVSELMSSTDVRFTGGIALGQATNLLHFTEFPTYDMMGVAVNTAKALSLAAPESVVVANEKFVQVYQRECVTPWSQDNNNNNSTDDEQQRTAPHMKIGGFEVSALCACAASGCRMATAPPPVGRIRREFQARAPCPPWCCRLRERKQDDTHSLTLYFLFRKTRLSPLNPARHLV